jgi:hypothetical protein
MMVMILSLCSENSFAKRKVGMITAIELNESTMTIKSQNHNTVIPLGYDIVINGIIENNNDNAIKIEDPHVSQNILIHLVSNKDKQETTFLLNPSIVDSMGEVTIPPRKEIELKPHEKTSVIVHLYSHVLDKCFAEGDFSISLSYGENCSAQFKFSIEFSPESVARLLELLNDSKVDIWVRKEACKWLNKVKPDFNYNFNENSIESFQFWWNKEKDSKEIKSRIEAIE